MTIDVITFTLTMIALVVMVVFLITHKWGVEYARTIRIWFYER